MAATTPIKAAGFQSAVTVFSVLKQPANFMVRLEFWFLQSAMVDLYNKAGIWSP